MVLSPTKDSRSSRLNAKADKPFFREWLSPDCFQENLDTENSFMKAKLEPKEGIPGDSVLQTSDLPNRQRNVSVTSKGAFHEGSRCGAKEDDQAVASDRRGDTQEEINKQDDEVFELPGMPDHIRISEANLDEKSKMHSVLESMQIQECHSTADKKLVTDEKVSQSPEMDQAASLEEEKLLLRSLPSSAAYNSTQQEELSKYGSNDSEDWIVLKHEDDDGLNGPKDRFVSEELPDDYDDGDDTDLAPLPFSGALSLAGGVPYSGPISHSGPIPFSGSISRRSDGSSASTRSFAFPILPFEWNASPVRMPPPDRRYWQRKRNWCISYLCCRRPSTHP